MDDGAQKKQTFDGALKKERCFEIELTCEESKAPGVYHAMRLAICGITKGYRIDTDWVHVSKIPMRGAHFSIQGHAFDKEVSGVLENV